MKKIKGTKHAHVGTSYTPIRDAKIDALQADIIARQARIDELLKKIKELLDYEA